MPQAQRQTVLLSGNGDQPIKSSDLKLLLLFPEDWGNFYCVDTNVLDFIQTHPQPYIRASCGEAEEPPEPCGAARRAQTRGCRVKGWSHNYDMALTVAVEIQRGKKAKDMMKDVRHAWMPLKVAWSWSNPAERKGREKDLALPRSLWYLVDMDVNEKSWAGEDALMLVIYFCQDVSSKCTFHTSRGGGAVGLIPDSSVPEQNTKPRNGFPNCIFGLS